MPNGPGQSEAAFEAALPLDVRKGSAFPSGPQLLWAMPDCGRSPFNKHAVTEGLRRPAHQGAEPD
jgi:hypothetical protein